MWLLRFSYLRYCGYVTEEAMTEDGGRSNKDFILVFCSDTGIRLLQDAGDIFCDGTFGTVKCCPPFCQIVVLQAKVEDKRALPAAYALLTRKVRICYIRYPVFRLQQQLDKVSHCTPKSLGSVECLPQEGIVGLHCLRAVV